MPVAPFAWSRRRWRPRCASGFLSRLCSTSAVARCNCERWGIKGIYAHLRSAFRCMHHCATTLLLWLSWLHWIVNPRVRSRHVHLAHKFRVADHLSDFGDGAFQSAKAGQSHGQLVVHGGKHVRICREFILNAARQTLHGVGTPKR